MTKGVCKDCGWAVYAHDDGLVQHVFAGDDDAMHEATLFVPLQQTVPQTDTAMSL